MQNSEFPINKHNTGYDQKDNLMYSDERNTSCKCIVTKPFSTCNEIRLDEEYIVTGLSSTTRNESDIKISLGYTHLTNHGVKVVEYLENELIEVCKTPLPCRVYQTQWLPTYPQLLAVATERIRFYEYQNRNLTVKESFLEEISNPVISIDWNHRCPEEMLVTRKNGTFYLLALQYRNSIKLVRKRELRLQCSSYHGCGTRFGTGIMESNIVTVYNNNEIEIFDHGLLNSYRFKPEQDDDFLAMECSKHDDYLIGLITEKNAYLYDMRYIDREVSSLYDFYSNETATCLCWSPHSPAIYIGTSIESVIKWRTDQSTMAESYYNQNKKITNIHCPEMTPNFLLTTCIDLPIDPYAAIIGAYST